MISTYENLARATFMCTPTASQWRPGDLPVLVVVDAGYDVTRLAFLLADLAVELLGRMRSDRVLYFPPPPQPVGKRGRKPKRGAEFKFEDPGTQPAPAITTVTDTTHYGKAVATAWDRLHPLLVRRSAWADYPEGELPVIEGTVIRLQVDHLRGDRSPRPVWLWWSATGAAAWDVDRLWQAFLRGFALEHTFRMLKQTLGWAVPELREPTAADRWTWLGHCRPHTTPSCPAPGRRPPQTLGAASALRAAHTCTCPPRISPPPREVPSAGRGTEIQHRRPWPTNRPEE
jgi:hypothetical protein